MMLSQFIVTQCASKALVAGSTNFCYFVDLAGVISLSTAFMIFMKGMNLEAPLEPYSIFGYYNAVIGL